MNKFITLQVPIHIAILLKQNPISVTILFYTITLWEPGRRNVNIPASKHL
jgi:hypothetical protein